MHISDTIKAQRPSTRARNLLFFLLGASLPAGQVCRRVSHRPMGVSTVADEFDDLKRASSGDLDALHRVMPLIYDRARQIAEAMLAGDRARQWVAASSLVNRAYLRLTEHREVDLADEARVMATLATIMRRIVIDVARREKALKRGGAMQRISLSAAAAIDTTSPIDALEIEDALVALAAVSPDAARVAELRLWGGLTLEQITLALDMPLSRVRSNWNLAKAWLARELAAGERSREIGGNGVS